jgi:SAM-dependent methyltransferase
MCENCLASFFQRVVVPRFVHMGCGMRRFSEMRSRLIPEAGGVVVEVGFGSGHNLPYYDGAKVERVIGVEPDAAMLDLASRHNGGFTRNVELLQAPAESMPLQDAVADTVVVTYAFCTIPDVGRAISEIRRVLRPGGRLLFIEHARSDAAFTRRWQERLDGLWGSLAGGCHLNRDPETALQDAGFVVRPTVRTRFAGTLWHLGTHVAGVATRPH